MMTGDRAAAPGATDEIPEALLQVMWTRASAARTWLVVIATTLVAASLSMTFVGMRAYAALWEVPDLGWAIALLTVFIGSLYSIPAVLLYRASAALQRASRSRSIAQLLVAFRLKAAFWRYTSIVLIVYLVLIGALLLVGQSLPDLAPSSGVM